MTSALRMPTSALAATQALALTLIPHGLQRGARSNALRAIRADAHHAQLRAEAARAVAAVAAPALLAR